MADVDIDQFGEHESRPEEPMDEHISLTPAGGGSTWDPSGVPGPLDPWEPTREQKTSFGGKSFETLKYEAFESFVKSLYRRISGSNDEPPGTINFYNFDLRNGQLYYKDNVNPLTTKKRTLRDRLGKEGLCDLGFDVPIGHITAHQFMASYRAGSQLPSLSDITRADDIELQEIAEKALRSIENLNQQVQEEPTEDLPMRELLGLDKQLRSIRGLLKVEVAKKVQLEERITKERRKLD